MSPRGRRGRGGSRGRRGPKAGAPPLAPTSAPSESRPRDPLAAEAPAPVPAVTRGGRSRVVREPRVGRRVTAIPDASMEEASLPEPADLFADEEDLSQEEIRAHNEIAADARSAPGAGPQAVAAFNTFLRALGIDPRRDPEYTVTAQLTADFLAERTAALRREPAPIRPSRYRGSAGETVRLEKIPVYGMCPHHLVPYFGSVSVKYMPTDRICGIGAIARLVRDLSCVPRLQESFTQALADAIERDLEPVSVEVTVRARHLCLEMRGVEQKALFVTEARRGAGSSAPKPQQAPGRR